MRVKSGRVDIKNPDEDVLSGFPSHGDPLLVDPPADPAPADPAPAPAPNDELRTLRERLDRTENELNQLRRATPPPVVKSVAPPNPDDEVDWDQEFFTSPKKALAKHKELVRKEITQDLESRYQRDRSTQVFWDDFYEKHKDLKTDHDLVDLTLKSNLAEMSAMPVAKAMERLADLTRERILRYSGNAKPRTPKAKVEGASNPAGGSRPAASPTENKVMSISELIRVRKDTRRRAAGA
jgi:hypothetical protein